MSVLFQILFPFNLLDNIERPSLCNTVGPWDLCLIRRPPVGFCFLIKQTCSLLFPTPAHLQWWETQASRVSCPVWLGLHLPSPTITPTPHTEKDREKQTSFVWPERLNTYEPILLQHQDNRNTERFTSVQSFSRVRL